MSKASPALTLRRPSVGLMLFVMGAMCLTGCGPDPNHRSNPLEPSLPTLVPAPAQTSTPTPSPGGVIHVGETVSGTLVNGVGECTFTTVDGGWGGLCQRFEITIPVSGILTATVRWVADAPLTLF